MPHAAFDLGWDFRGCERGERGEGRADTRRDKINNWNMKLAQAAATPKKTDVWHDMEQEVRNGGVG